MKRLLLVSCALALGACSMFTTPMPPPAPPVQPAPVVQAAGAPIERIPFRAGVSSVTVERLGKNQACTSNQGAGLVTEPGPIEVYRMVCDSGRVFMARCELRQCKAM
jgi:hypothetical protein